VAYALAGGGASVVIGGRSEKHGQEALVALQARLPVAGSPSRAAAERLAFVPADVRLPDEAQRLIDAAVSRFGGLDILVNNAGVGGFSDVEGQPIEEWQAVIDTNLSGPFYCSRAAIPIMKRRGGGWIVNISSLSGTHPFAGGAAYSASKAGLNAFSEALMQEVRHDGIRVAVVAPGSVDTDFGAGPRSGHEWKLTADDVARAVLDLIGHDRRSLPSLIELRPSRPRR
jgi:NAD(P)-dependent dehydrogenase (short-subunit alcohol dehydrogenase family)